MTADPRDLATTLHEATANLHAYIEHRAEEIAAPRIAQAEAATAAQAAEMKTNFDFEMRRLGDLRDELRRHLLVMEQQNEQLRWLAQYLPEPLKPLALGARTAPRPPQTLTADWLALVEKLAGEVPGGGLLAGEVPGGGLLAEIGDDRGLLIEAAAAVARLSQTSAPRIQRKIRVGFAKAARLLDLLEQCGIVGPPQEKGTREVLVKIEDLPAVLEKLGITTPERNTTS
ncbi:DNA translocase FtsK [Streptosporangium sp. NPDC002524]|uniref:DNA translocase FtsK n=1 Tax=Streptosporangium sp. NPDC002524 TaxID=3154537 RepID=UPI00332D8B60